MIFILVHLIAKVQLVCFLMFALLSVLCWLHPAGRRDLSPQTAHDPSAQLPFSLSAGVPSLATAQRSAGASFTHKDEPVNTFSQQCLILPYDLNWVLEEMRTFDQCRRVHHLQQSSWMCSKIQSFWQVSHLHWFCFQKHLERADRSHTWQGWEALWWIMKGVFSSSL